MNLQSIADIHDEIFVLMPSGMPATLCVCDDGVIVDYGQGIKDTYSTDEFGKIVADGIQVFEKPSQMVIEDFNNKDHIEKQNKLDRIVKCDKDTKNRQIARGLLDRLNLGADDDKEIEKFVKKANKNEKLEIKRNKTMDIKKMNKVLESYINEISDETVNKVADKRKHNFKKAERNFSNAVKKSWKNTENIKDSEDRYNEIMNQTDKTEKKYAQANQKLQNNKLLNKLRDRRKDESKINEISDLSANLANALRTERTINAAKDVDIARRNWVKSSRKGRETALNNMVNAENEFDKSIKKQQKSDELLAKRNKRKEQSKNESYVVREMIGNYSTVVGRFDLFDEAQDFLMSEWYKYAEENNIDLDNESEQQNFFSYYSLEEIKNESKILENTNKKGAYINRAEGKYAVHASKNGGAVKYTNSLDSAYNFLQKQYGINKEDVEYIKESKINEGNYDSQGDAWYNFCKNVKNYAKEHGVDIDEAIYQELDDMVYFSDVINVWTNMPGNLGSRASEITELMREDIQEGAFEDIDFIQNLDESKINEKMSVKKAKELYKKQGFLDSEDDKEAIEVLKNADYTIKTNSRGTASVIELDRMRESFGDTMLTDINDLDFPQALQDTVETDDEGELLTLGKVADQIKDLKDELVDELKDIKDDLKDEINDIKKDMQDEISDELTDEELADIEDIEFEDVPMEVEEPVEETEEIETEEIDEPKKKEKEEKETDEDKEDKEDKIEESFKKYITKGKYEDLAQTKREVDKLTQQGKDAKEIKDTITLLADDEKEEDEAEKYAVSKLKESLLATSRTSKLNNL